MTLVSDLAGAESTVGRSRRPEVGDNRPRRDQPGGAEQDGGRRADNDGPSPLGVPQRDGRRTRTRVGATVVVVAAIGASIWATGVGRRPVINPGGWEQVRQFFAAALHPELDPAFLRLAADAALVTVGFALLGTALSLGIGVVGGLAATSAWNDTGHRPAAPRVARAIVRVALVPLRSVHEAVWALLLVAVLGLNPLVAVVAIGVPFGAVTAKVFAEVFDELPRGPFLALRAAGVSKPAAFAYGVLPNAARTMLSYSFYRFECGIRAAAVLGVIGAGGIGFQIKLSFQSLNYEEMWTLIAFLVLMCGVADWWGSTLRRSGRIDSFRSSRRASRRWLFWHRRTAAQGLPDRDGAGAGAGAVAGANEVRRNRADDLRTQARRRRGVIVASGVGLAVALVVSWRQLKINPSSLWAPRARTNFSRLVEQLWPPVTDDGIADLLAQTGQTLAMSVLAITGAFGGAWVMAFVAARPGTDRTGRHRHGRRGRIRAGLMRFGLLVTRAIPPPVWALVFVFVCFPGVLPGALALGIYNLGVLGRLMAEMAEQQDDRSTEALRASGASPLQVVVYDRAPRLAAPFLAFGLYRWEVTIRETVVVGLVAAGGLGYALNQQLAAFDYHAVSATLLALVAVTVLVDIASMAARRLVR